MGKRRSFNDPDPLSFKRQNAKLDKIASLLERQNELLSALVAAEYTSAQQNEQLLKGLLESPSAIERNVMAQEDQTDRMLASLYERNEVVRNFVDDRAASGRFPTGGHRLEE